jgi:hypothetical protein
VALASPSVLANGTLLLEGGRADEGRYQCAATLQGTGTILSRIARVSFQGEKRVLNRVSFQGEKRVPVPVSNRVSFEGLKRVLYRYCTGCLSGCEKVVEHGFLSRRVKSLEQGFLSR